MALVETLADALAKEALAAMEKTGDEKLTDDISKAIGASSPTMQEEFLTAVRVRRAEKRGRDLLEDFNAHGRKSVKSEPSGAA